MYGFSAYGRTEYASTIRAGGASINLSDTLDLSDSIIRTAGRTLTDTIVLSDTFASLKVIAKFLSDSIDLSDIAVITLTKVITDTIIITDSIMTSVEKFFQDTIDLSDSVLATGSRTLLLNEILTLADLMNKSNFLRIMDTILMVDGFRNLSWTRRVKPAEGTWTPRTKPSEGTWTPRTKPPA